MEEEARVVVAEGRPEVEGASVTEVAEEVVEVVEEEAAALALEEAGEEAGTQISPHAEAFEGVDHSMQIWSRGASVLVGNTMVCVTRNITIAGEQIVCVKMLSHHSFTVIRALGSRLILRE